MNASGKTTSRAPLPAASATSSASRSMVASRSNTTGSAWTQATFTGSRTGVVLADATVTLPRRVGELHGRDLRGTDRRAVPRRVRGRDDGARARRGEPARVDRARQARAVLG